MLALFRVECVCCLILWELQESEGSCTIIYNICFSYNSSVLRSKLFILLISFCYLLHFPKARISFLHGHNSLPRPMVISNVKLQFEICNLHLQHKFSINNHISREPTVHWITVQIFQINIFFVYNARSEIDRRHFWPKCESGISRKKLYLDVWIKSFDSPPPISWTNGY